MSCARAREFLAQESIDVTDVADAKKQRLGRREALALARGADEIVVSKGKKTVVVDMRKSPPADAELAALLLGPTGNLRAPTIRRGKTLLVGFDRAAYERAFAGKAAAPRSGRG